MIAQPGNIVGRWQLLERLGVGGMGEVWRAQDTRAADSKVKADAILSAARARFEEGLAHIEEPRLRQAFRENVPAHRRLAGLINA